MGCNLSKLGVKKHHRTSSVEYSYPRIPSKKSSTDQRLVVSNVSCNISILLICSQGDDQMELWSRVAEAMGHEVTKIIFDYAEIDKWIKKYAKDALYNRNSGPINPPMLFQRLGDETTLPDLEVVIIDRRLSTYYLVSDTICDYIRTYQHNGSSAIILALQAQSKSSKSYEAFPKGVLESGYNKPIFHQNSAMAVCQEMMTLGCNEVPMLRRIKRLHGSNPRYSAVYDKQASAPHLSISQQGSFEAPGVRPSTANHSGQKSRILSSSSNQLSGESNECLPNTSSQVLMAPIKELDEKYTEHRSDESEELLIPPKPDSRALAKSVSVEHGDEFRAPACVPSVRRFSLDPTVNSLLRSSHHATLCNDVFNTPPLDANSTNWNASQITHFTQSIMAQRENKMYQSAMIRRSRHLKRNSSTDTPSEKTHRRKESWIRLQNLGYDSPLTQVIKLITNAKEKSSTPIAKDLQQALELMLSTDLFTGLMKPGQNVDQTTSDLIEGLMTNFKKNSDAKPRSSKDSTSTDNRSVTPMLTSQVSITSSPEIDKVMQNDDQWSFDIIQLEKVTSKKPLSHLAMKVFGRFNVCSLLGCTEKCMFAWLQVMEQNYHSENAYHNATHAADVMQASAAFLQRPATQEIMEPMDNVAVLLAAVVHDVDHPGRTNPFLVNSSNDLAILYNDIAVLESHHASLAFKLTRNSDALNIFKNMPKEEFRPLRKEIIDLVLATEMARHFEHVTKFVNNISNPLISKPVDDDQSQKLPPFSDTMSNYSDSLKRNSLSSQKSLSELMTPENKMIFKRMIIKCSDVNNPTRPLELCKVWAVRIAEEYFNQTDDEKKLGLPVVMPTFDRQTCNIPKSQTSFIDFFLKDMFTAMDAAINCPEVLENLESNYSYWKAKVPD